MSTSTHEQPEQLDLFEDEDYEMVWNYGLAEWWTVDADTGETTVDHAKIIEIFYDANDPKDLSRSSWSDTSLISDNAQSMMEILDRVAKDIEKRGNKPTVVVIMDADTYTDKEWFWTDAPENILKYRGYEFIDYKEEK